MNDQDFSKYPLSVTERKAEKADGNGGAVWTPRDALIAALRDLDSGEIIPDILVICVGEKDEKKRERTTYYRASPSFYASVGLIEAVKGRMLE